MQKAAKLKNVLYILAHNDDEFFFLDSIERELQAGNQVFVTYLTHGSIYGPPHEVRHSESLFVLTKLGIPKENVCALGFDHDIFDSKLDENIGLALNAIHQKFSSKDIAKIYTLAWEGGNTDHDSCCYLSSCLAVKWSIPLSNVFAFPGYNATTKIPFYFRIMSLPPAGEALYTKIGLLRALWMISFIRHYPSQRKTFFGLLPGILCQLLLKRRVEFQTLDKVDFKKRPHQGNLLYESRFGKNYDIFSKSLNNRLDDI